MIHITKPEDVQAYFDNPALNQSSLKKLPDRLAFMELKQLLRRLRKFFWMVNDRCITALSSKEGPEFIQRFAAA